MAKLVLDFKKIDMCKELTHTQRALIKKIHLLSQKEGFCYASNKGLADMMAMSASGIEKVVRRLSELGFINRVIIKENGNERHITLTKKAIEMFKKVSETVKKVANNIKPKNLPKQQKLECEPSKEVVEANEQNEDNKEIKVSEEVKTVLSTKLGLEADHVVEELENKYGADEVVKAIDKAHYTSLKTKKLIGSTKYLLKMFANGLVEKNNNVKRKEMIDGKNFSYDENRNLVCNYTNPTPKKESEYTKEELDKIEYMNQLKSQLLGGLM